MNLGFIICLFCIAILFYLELRDQTRLLEDILEEVQDQNPGITVTSGDPFTAAGENSDPEIGGSYDG